MDILHILINKSLSASPVNDSQNQIKSLSATKVKVCCACILSAEIYRKILLTNKETELFCFLLRILEVKIHLMSLCNVLEPCFSLTHNHSTTRDQSAPFYHYVRRISWWYVFYESKAIKVSLLIDRSIHWC